MKNVFRTVKGFTLIEAVVSLIILLILSGMLFTILIQGKTVWQASATHSSSRQDIQVLFSKVAQELKGSNISRITDGGQANLKAFSFVSAVDSNGVFVTDSSGKPIWQKYVIYYIPGQSDNLLRKEVAILSGQSATALTTQQLSAYLDGKGVIVSKDMSSIRLTPVTDKSYAVLQVTTSSVNNQGKSDQQNAQQTIAVYKN